MGGLLGIFRKNKIVKNKEKNENGDVSVSYAIENKDEGSSISNLGGDLGIQKSAVVSASDVMSVESSSGFMNNFIFGQTKIATLRDGSIQDISPISSTIDLPVGPGGSGKLINAGKIAHTHIVQKSSYFRNAKLGTVADLTKKLSDGTLMAKDIPAIAVHKIKGILYSLNNRRLKAFKDAGKEILTRPANKKEISKIKKLVR